MLTYITGRLLAEAALAPIKGLAWIAEKLKEEADKELLDEGKVQGQLLKLELMLDMGEISEEEFEETEKLLLERLNAIWEYKKAQMAEEM